VPCHNRAALLGRGLEAYAQQAAGVDFEIVAVDDGSTDDTREVLRTHRSERFALRAVHVERSAGPANARNLGSRRARAPFS